MNNQLLQAMLTQLARDYTDAHHTMSVAEFAAWLTRYHHDIEVQRNLDKPLRHALSPTGRFPSQPEIQELPKRRVGMNPAVTTPYGVSRYNKDRQPVEVYKATAESVIAQSRSYQEAAIKDTAGGSVADMLETEWVHMSGDVVTAFVPSEPGSSAALSVGRVFLGRVNIHRVEEGSAAVKAAREYLVNLQGGV